MILWWLSGWTTCGSPEYCWHLVHTPLKQPGIGQKDSSSSEEEALGVQEDADEANSKTAGEDPNPTFPDLLSLFRFLRCINFRRTQSNVSNLKSQTFYFYTRHFLGSLRPPGVPENDLSCETQPNPLRYKGHPLEWFLYPENLIGTFPDASAARSASSRDVSLWTQTHLNSIQNIVPSLSPVWENQLTRREDFPVRDTENSMSEGTLEVWFK